MYPEAMVSPSSLIVPALQSLPKPQGFKEYSPSEQTRSREKGFAAKARKKTV
jgi:hypothetical protein